MRNESMKLIAKVVHEFGIPAEVLWDLIGDFGDNTRFCLLLTRHAGGRWSIRTSATMRMRTTTTSKA